VALGTTCIKNVKIKIIETRTGCHYGGLLLQRKPNGPHKTFDWAGGPHVARGLSLHEQRQKSVIKQ